MKKKKIIYSALGLLLIAIMLLSSFILPAFAADTNKSSDIIGPAPPVPNQSDLNTYLEEHALTIDEKGGLHYTNADSAYLNPEVYQEIMRLLGKNIFIRAGDTVVLDVNNILNVDVSFNDGIYENRFFPKRVNGEVAFCVEHGSPLSGGNNPGYTPYPTTTDTELHFALISYFGYHMQPSYVNECMTQFMIWEAQGSVPTSIYGDVTMSQYNDFKSAVNARIATFHKKPSFTGQSITLNVGESITLTDANGVFSLYEQTENTAGVTIQKNGNEVTLTASAASADSGKVSFAYGIEGTYKGTSIYYRHPNTQDVIVTKVHTQTSTSLDIKVNKEGYGRVIKKSADTGKVLNGAKYIVTNNRDSSIEHLTTGTDGTATTKPYLHGTILTIKEETAPNHYVINDSPQTITIVANTTQEATFSNSLAKGTIRVDKSALRNKKDMQTDSYTLAGNVFYIYDSTGKHVDSLTTNASGKAESQTLDIGKYTVKEITASDGFIINPKTYEVEIKYEGQTIPLTHADFEAINTEQMGSATLYKRDRETNSTAQGKSTFEGAVFKLERKEKDGSWKKMGEYTTDSKGGLTVKDLYLATYRFVEIKAPEGYVFDDTPVVFELKYAGQNAETAITPISYKYNKVITGSIEGLKVAKPLTGGTNEDIMRPLAGVEFTATSQTTKKTYTGITDANGKFVINNLPYDDYVLSETKGIEGYSLIKPVPFTVLEEKQVIEYILDNRLAEQRIKVEKVDAQTGNIIPVADVSFKIFDKLEDAYISMRIPNTDKENDVFTTNSEGYFVTSDTLKYGVDRYVLEEVDAPNGYILSQDKITFSVSGNVTSIQEISFGNDRAKGTATLTKHGNKPLQIKKSDSDYGILYTISSKDTLLSDVEYKIYAAEDIIGKEGTVFHKKDALIDTIMTGKDGKAITKPLELGKYYAIETSAPAGVVIDRIPIPFEIKYANQNIALTNTDITANNKWQDLKVTVHKQEEQLSKYEDGKAVLDNMPANEKVFGLFAEKAIKLSNGEKIKADSLLAFEIVKDGIATFNKLQFPEGNYYIQELQTDDSHILDENKYPFAYAANNAAALTIEVGKDNPLLNKLYLTDVPFQKVNESFAFTEKKGYTYSYDTLGENATFELLNSEDKVIQTVTINNEGMGLWTDLQPGTYYQRETGTSDETYVLSRDVIKIVVTKESVSVYNGEDEITLTNEDYLFTIENDLIKGSVSLVKKDADKKSTLAGAIFKLLNEDGIIVFEGETDSKGILTVKDLPFGNYTFVEVKAPEGYVLDETPIKVSISKHGDTSTCEMVNKRIPEEPKEPKEPEKPQEPKKSEKPKSSSAPKTGDDTNVVLLVAELLVVLTIGIVVLIKRRNLRF